MVVNCLCWGERLKIYWLKKIVNFNIKSSNKVPERTNMKPLWPLQSRTDRTHHGKSAENVKSKSLKLFQATYEHPYAVRVSAKNFGFENGIKSVPLYALFCLRG